MSGSSLFASLGAALQNLSSPRSSARVSSPTAGSHPGPSAFESELTAQLEQLKSTDEGGYLSARWLCQAIGVVLCAHASVEAFVPDLRQALADGDTKWLDEYLDDSVKLLDVCSALREAVDDIKDYLVYVELALNAVDKGKLGEAQLQRAKNALSKCTEALKRTDEDVSQRRSKLENCSSMLRRMGEKLNLEDASKGKFFVVIYAAQVTTIFVCGMLTTGLSFKPRRPLSMVSVAGQSGWAFSLSGLQQRVKEQVDRKKSKGSSALLVELDKTDLAVHCLEGKVEQMLNSRAFPVSSDQAEEMKTLVGSLRESSAELKQGVDPLERHIGEVFKVLVASRMALLDIYGHL